ncbi:hypothetical protein K450DRAFT_224971 [Umbelopsis ramanniana AG]|uniref:Enoyl reductase (ER) domain-containing protein n=1 Tax=Umbelopsis ramanniana AG TaxID=1314678 RepID=A0AAD5EIA3_UMBRA|nr:uncharacterized protein K450DRAFT_224971 [Umbelopsis ramanniana AG]KAI8582820.1 hypothetical protein K450DRAFT_224971 [Umbelopsis ramanniana AG]
MTTTEQFVGYAVLQPYVKGNKDTELKVHTFESRPLESDDVEVEVAACGICGTDIHQLTNGWNRANFPLIPGHEFIGHIVAVGDKVSLLKIGDRVGVSPVAASCGTCKECTSAFGQLCANRTPTYNGVHKGYKTYGGYANKVRVQESWAIKVPDNISSEEGAPLLCAGITTYLPFKHHNLGPQQRVGILGIGGLGHLAIQWARARGCKEVVVISSSSNKKEEAIKLGATQFVLNSSEELAKRSKSLDALLVCGSGPSTNWAQLLDLLDDHGKLILLDLPEQPIAIPPGALVYRHLSMVGSFVGSNVDLAEMLAFASETGVRPWVEKVGNSCEEVNNGIKQLMSGKARYRVVICGKGRQ